MKHLLLPLICSALALAPISSPAADKTTDGPRIEFKQKAHDFGSIREKGDPATCAFEFTNTGSQPLVIVSAYASCGCTRPEAPTKPVAPGKKGKIKVTFNPRNRPGEFTKTITVRTNDPKNKKTKLKISGFVTPADQ